MNNCELEAPFQFTSLVTDLDHYKDTFLNAFVPNTTQRSETSRWLETSLGSEVVDQIKRHQPPNSDDVSIMGVGSGDGKSAH